MSKKDQVANSTKIAGRTYEVSDYKKDDLLSSGLAETHEQVSDAYFEGDIGSDEAMEREGENNK